MEVLQLLTVLFGIAGFAGGAVGYFAKGRADAVIALSAKEIELLTNANTRLEKTNISLTTERDRFAEENATLTKLAEGSQLAEAAQDMRDSTRTVRSLIKELEKVKRK